MNKQELQVNRGEYPVSGRNTTVAQVLVQVQNAGPGRYVRKALAESFRRRARISLEVTAAESLIFTVQCYMDGANPLI